MVDGVDVPYYYRLSNGNFQALPGSPPVSALVETTDFAVILVPPNSQTFYSNVADTASWTPNAAAEVYQIAIDSTEGNITGVHRLRSGVAFYKQNAIHFASFVGGLIGWDIAIVSMTVGAAGNECVVAVGDYHYIWGPDDFWQFDGYNLTRMPNNLKEWVFRDLDQAYVQNIAGRYDVQRDLVFWHYPSTSASPRGTLDSYICTYLRTGKWAFGRLTIDLPMVGEMPAPLHTETTPDPAIAMPDHNVYIYDDLNTGVITSGVYITSNDFGDRQFMYQTRRIRPGFSTYPVPGASGAPPVRVTPMVQMTTTGTTPVSGDQVAISDDGWVNLMVTGRLTRFKVNFYGTAETAQGVIDINRLGEV